LRGDGDLVIWANAELVASDRGQAHGAEADPVPEVAAVIVDDDVQVHPARATGRVLLASACGPMARFLRPGQALDVHVQQGTGLGPFKAPVRLAR
jgi:hypothetical protein